MSAERLSLALASGALSLPHGRILLMRPPADLSLDGLPATIVAEQGFRPDHDALAARGIDVTPHAVGAFDAAVVFVARSKALTLDLVSRACARLPEGATVVIDGQKGDGVDSILRQCRKAFDVGEAFSKSHGKTFSFPARPAPDGWASAPTRVDGFMTCAGIFSADGVDPGSALLAQHVGGLSGRVCDLGAGWGYLARAVLAQPKVTACALVEADHDALDCARANVTDPRATFHWADAASWAGGPFDVVVSNPPFHTTRKADPSLGRAFIASAARLLTPSGRLLMVANRHLPYEGTLDAAFAQVRVLAETGGFKVIEARRPKRARERT